MDNFTVLNFTNIDEEDFEGMYGGKTELIRRGQTKAFPAKIAKHFAEQLVYKILVKKGKEPYIDPERQELIDEILGKPKAVEETSAPKEAIEEAVAEEKEEEFPELKAKKKVKKTKK